MPRIEPVSEGAESPELAAVIERCRATGTPDERMSRVIGKSEIGARYLMLFSEMMTGGLLPHRLKELVRIRMSVAEECGYCSSIRSKLALEEGLTEDVVMEMIDLAASRRITPREKMAIRFADQIKTGDVDSDQLWTDLHEHFTDEEIIELGVFCGYIHGGGPFAVALQVLTWEQACEIRPTLGALHEADAVPAT